MATDTETRSVWELANLADVRRPDSDLSHGGVYLRQVQDDYIMARDNDELGDVYDGDRIHELADAAVPVYTWQMWQTFIDLCAWEVDTEDYGPPSDSDMTKQAMVALYVVAHTLLTNLFWDDRENDDNDDNDDTENDA